MGREQGKILVTGNQEYYQKVIKNSYAKARINPRSVIKPSETDQGNKKLKGEMMPVVVII